MLAVAHRRYILLAKITDTNLKPMGGSVGPDWWQFAPWLKSVGRLQQKGWLKGMGRVHCFGERNVECEAAHESRARGG